jgi:hypothetical protein
MTELELTKQRPTPDSVGMGSYTIDSHNIQRYITPEGHVQNEGDIGVSTRGPYEIAYGSLVPKKGQVDNLLVPVCVSSSHIAFGSIRMEPVFMILAQSAATAAAMALDAGLAVQDVPYTALKARLEADGQVLTYTGPAVADSHSEGISAKSLPGVVVDDEAAVLTGDWKRSHAAKKFIGQGYQHDGKAGNGKHTARFETKLPKTARYEVRLACPPNANRATNVKVLITHAKGETTVTANLSAQPTHDGLFHNLGTYEFQAGQTAAVSVKNEATDGYLVLDAVQWLEAN